MGQGHMRRSLGQGQGHRSKKGRKSGFWLWRIKWCDRHLSHM